MCLIFPIQLYAMKGQGLCFILQFISLNFSNLNNTNNTNLCRSHISKSILYTKYNIKNKMGLLSYSKKEDKDKRTIGVFIIERGQEGSNQWL